MAKLTHRHAFYANGDIIEAKTDRKKFNTTNLAGVISYYEDGTRQEEELTTKPKLTVAQDDIDHQIARLQFEAHKQFKYDGGDTPEIRKLRNKKRGISHLAEGND